MVYLTCKKETKKIHNKNGGKESSDQFNALCKIAMHLVRNILTNMMPVVFLCTTPWFAQYLTTAGQNKDFSVYNSLTYLAGNYVSWLVVATTFVWAILWLLIPSPQTYGPVTFYNERPQFPDNAIRYYMMSIIFYIICQFVYQDLNNEIFWNMPYIIGSLNVTAFLLCIYMFLKTPEHPNPENSRYSPLYLFYSGVELHPSICGIQIKQLTICRVGLILWQIFVLAFYIAGLRTVGFNSGSFVNCLIQTIYLAKCFYWEDGYFWTIDIVHDNAGYYLCWGCLVFVPSLYTYTSYFMVLHPPTVSNMFSLILLVAGVFSLFMNYRVDYEKQEFQKNRYNENFTLWGNKVEYITVNYENMEGKQCESRLLVSGCWGVARHLNYFFELLVTLCWTLPGIGNGIHAFFHLIFLLGLLLHRCYRDEDRCFAKYGDGYNQYCKIVPYRIVPYVF